VLGFQVPVQRSITSSMAMPTLRALLALTLASQSAATRELEAHGANPIRKVVRLLQDMEKKITSEGEEGEELYKKYMCYCKSGGKDLADQISAAGDKIPAVGLEIEAADKEKAQLDKDVEKAQSDRAEAKATMAEATATREEEAAAFAKEKGEYETNIAAIKKAVDALKTGAYGSFLQTGAAATLRKILATSGQVLDDAAMDMPEMLSFLTGAQKQSANYAPQSGEVIGILEQLGDEMAKDLSEVVDTESKAIQAYEAVMKAKQKEVALCTETIERKMGRSADLGVSIVTMENDLSDTQKALLEDQKFAEDLKATCANKTSEWEEDTKVRKEELKAIAETIEMLNDDDALELFKATLPSAAASFVQLEGLDAAKTRALQILRTAAKGDQGGMRRLDFIGLALKGKAVGFDKIIKMIDDMVKVIKEEQLADENKKEYCAKEFDLTEDKMKKLAWHASNIQKAITDTEDSLKVATEIIEDTTQSIAELDKEVADATELRKKEHEFYLKLTRDDTAAKQLLDLAKNRLFQFYTPQLHTTTTTTLAREDQIYTAFGGTVLAQLATMSRHSKASRHSEAPPPPPEAPAAYSKKAEESTGVIAMIDLLIKDLDTEITQAETDEKNNQEAYDALMKSSAKDRAAHGKALTESVLEKAELEAALKSHKDAEQANNKDTQATSQYEMQLHADCDWLLQYFTMRTDARSSEVDALVNAKAVLSGANYALVEASALKMHRNLRARAVQLAM